MSFIAFTSVGAANCSRAMVISPSVSAPKPNRTCAGDIASASVNSLLPDKTGKFDKVSLWFIHRQRLSVVVEISILKVPTHLAVGETTPYRRKCAAIRLRHDLDELGIFCELP